MLLPVLRLPRSLRGLAALQMNAGNPELEMEEVTGVALRLIEMVVEEKDGGEIRELLKAHTVLEHRQVRLGGGEVLVRILLDAEHSEAVMDALAELYPGDEARRVVMMPVEATLPRVEAEPPTALERGSAGSPLERIGREELYEDIKDGARCTRVYLAMVVLSTIVAGVGLYHNSVAIIIGAMVMAPLLGPNVALALGTTLGDLPLLRRGLLTALAGIATAMALSGLMGLLAHVDPALPEVASRTRVRLGDVGLALASGCAGALAFTTGVSTTLIGVMVAVAMLPPLVAFGLLIGGGEPALAMNALALFLMNLICVNLAGVITFLAQGIRPATWWEKDRASRATRIAIALWAGLLVALVGLVLLLRKI